MNIGFWDARIGIFKRKKNVETLYWTLDRQTKNAKSVFKRKTFEAKNLKTFTDVKRKPEFGLNNSTSWVQPLFETKPFRYSVTGSNTEMPVEITSMIENRFAEIRSMFPAECLRNWILFVKKADLARKRSTWSPQYRTFSQKNDYAKQYGLIQRFSFRVCR